MAFDDPSVAVKKEFVPEESQDKDRLSSEASEAFRAQSKSNARDQSRPSDLNGVTMVNRDDGTYLFDKQGRLFESASSDGKANIAYHYDDPENPNRITKEVLNCKIETRYLGPVTVDGKPLTVDGHEVNGYSIFENGQLKGNWSGIRSVDKDGTRVIGSGFSSANEAAYQRCDASGQKLVAEAKPLNNMQAEKKASLFDLAANHSAALESGVKPKEPIRQVNFEPQRVGQNETVLPALVLEEKSKPERLVAFRKPEEVEKSDTNSVTKSSSTESAVNSKVAVLEDGTYTRDANNRVIEMVSPDGKTKHTFKRADPNFPDRITSEVINDQEEYRFIGNCKSGGKPVILDGKENNSYSIYDMKGQLKGNWSGIRHVSPEGVFSVGTGSIAKAGEKGYDDFGASGNKLTEAEVERRNSGGIWPERRECEHTDGTKYRADLLGKDLRSLTEQKEVGGKLEEHVWHKGESGYTCDKLPGEIRKNLELGQDKSLSYEDKDGVRHVKYQDGSSDTVKDGSTQHFDALGQLAKITGVNGDSRSFSRSGADVTAYTDTKAGQVTTWQRSASDKDSWSSAGKSETRVGLKTTADGAIEYKNADGNRVRENAQFSKIEFNSDNKPVKVTQDRSERTFEWSGEQLKSIVDKVKSRNGDSIKAWSSADGKTLTREVNGRTRTCELAQAPSEDGDYGYKNSDGKSRLAKVTNLEKQADGALGGSENVVEAREDFMDALKASGLSEQRADKYLKAIDGNVKRYDLKPEQIAATLDNLRELLTSPEKSPYFSAAERKTLAETALHNIANNMEIDQGSHPTCNVTTVEVYTAARHPDQYARLVKEVGLTGKWTTSEGRVANIPIEAVRPGEDEAKYNLEKPNSKLRNMASQVVEMTLINAMYEHGYKNEMEFVKKPDGSLVTENGKAIEKLKEDKTGTRYVLDKPEQKSETKIGANGQKEVISWQTSEDKFRDASGKLHSAESGGPGFTTFDNVQAGKLVFGYNMPYFEGPATPEGGRPEYDMATEERLLKIKAENKFPHGIATMGGIHVQTIHDVTRGKDGKLYILLDNQHGESTDGWTTIDEIAKTQVKSGYEIEPKIRRWDRPDK